MCVLLIRQSAHASLLDLAALRTRSPAAATLMVRASLLTLAHHTHPAGIVKHRAALEIAAVLE
jgi:hypothetical protein